MSEQKRIKHFSHTDLDGVGCTIISKLAYGERVDAVHCDYNNVNETVEEFLEAGNLDDYELILITDISVKEELAEKLNELFKTSEIDIMLVDHHNTALWLNDYDWAYVYSEYEDEEEGRTAKSSGTSMLYEILSQEAEFPVGAADFAEQVRRYDTWEWNDIYETILPKELNDYLYMVGRGKFANLMLATIPSNDPGKEVYFDVTARALLDQKQAEIKDYIKKKNDQLQKVVIETDKDGNDVLIGVVFAEQHVSELGNELCKIHEDIQYVVMIEPGRYRLSFRTRRDDIDLGEVAKAYDGGGHPKAAGGKFSEQLIDDLFNELF